MGVWCVEVVMHLEKCTGHMLLDLRMGGGGGGGGLR